ncbi:MAG: phosphatidate cytidylyltransferase [Pseudohongiellaceae bacterium]
MSGALKTRVITAIILLLGLVAVAMFLPPLPFALIIGGIVMMAAWEWTGFIGLPDPVARLPYMLSILLALVGSWLLLGIEPDNADINRLASATVLTLGLLFWLLAFMLLRGYPDNTRKWNNRSGIALMGLMALVPTWVGIVQLKYLMPEGWLVLGLIVMVAAVDVGAFFAGTAFGHTKLAEKLSPNKSWEGVWGGLFTCFCLGLLLTWGLHRFLMPLTGSQMLALVLLSLTVTFFGVTGDLVESMLKRNRDIKDSGALLPGHGGLLDRVDGLMAVTPAFVLTVLLTVADIR